jgi:peptidoglycan/LPS O-acetylase OafA/YrhL
VTQLASVATSRVSGLDGLRALAVGAVVVFHSGLGVLPGGEIGVDLFMVLSGYLITTLLLAEQRSRGAISIRDFYIRRALRLFPALILLIVVLVLVTAVADSGQAFELNRGMVLSCMVAMAYLSDVAVGWGLWPGFAADAPLLHTWSLAIEEHFYLLWAPLIGYAAPRVGVRRLTRWLAATAVLMVLWTSVLDIAGAGLARIIYSPDTRGIGLIVGAAMASYLWERSDRVNLHRAAPWVSLLGFLALMTVPVMHEWAGRGPMLAIALLSAIMIAGVIDTASTFSRMWSWTPFTFVGRRAYGIYLWHFPVFHFISKDRFDLGSLELAALKIAVTMMFVELSYDLVEKPALRLRKSFSPTRSSAADTGGEDLSREVGEPGRAVSGPD